MFVCICKGITDNAIRQAVANGANSLNDVTQQLGVAANCGQCADLANEIIDTQLLAQAAMLAYEAA